MKGIETAMELVRPLVESKAWDFCAVWKLGDDPSRFIQWVGCCCGGGSGDGGGGGKVKMERGEDSYSAPLCRDLYIKHPIRTKACEALAVYPSFMPLDYGIHGEVVTSTQLKWITHASANSSPDSVGTRVMIPVHGGLIELFAARHIEKDQKIIDFITAESNVLKQEATISHGYFSCIDPFLEQNLPSPSHHLLGLIPQTQVLYPLYQSNYNHSTFEGSSSGPNPSNEPPSLDFRYGYLLHGILKQTIGKSSSSGLRKPKNYDILMKQKTRSSFPERQSKRVGKVIQKSERDNFRSKNLVTERNRRNRIKDGLFSLRALVPKISKMDKASTLGDAIEYIGELQKEVKKLEDDLKDIEEEECKESNAEGMSLNLEAVNPGRNNLLPPDNNQDSSTFAEKGKIEIEVNQIGKREFLIKLFYEHKRGGFGRLMNAIDSLGLQVVDANMTTFQGKVLNILKVEANMKDVQPKKISESLLKL